MYVIDLDFSLVGMIDEFLYIGWWNKGVVIFLDYYCWWCLRSDLGGIVDSVIMVGELFGGVIDIYFGGIVCV